MNENRETAPAEHDGHMREQPSAHGSVLVELSNAVVGIHKRFYGKGPTKARSHLSQDLLIVVLEGGYTRGEQTLHEHGYDEQVRQSRHAMQDAVEAELRGAIEDILGRPVRSFMSANDPEHEMSAEVFVFHPRPDGDHDQGMGERAARAREQHRALLDEHRALRAEQVQSREALHRRSHPED